MNEAAKLRNVPVPIGSSRLPMPGHWNIPYFCCLAGFYVSIAFIQFLYTAEGAI